nr:DNA polymerase III subunit beta [bacterium]
LTFGPNQVDVMADSPDIGEANESLDVKYEGQEFSIAFNPEFLMAPLKNLEEDEVHLDLIDEMSPGVLRTEDAFLYVLMPMRVTS